MPHDRTPPTTPLEATRRAAGAEAFVPRDSSAATDTQFDECSALFAELWLIGFLATVGHILATNATAGVGKDLHALRRNRLSADFANDGLLPVAGCFVFARVADHQSDRLTLITCQLSSIRVKQLANHLLRRMRRPPQQTECSQSPRDFDFATGGLPAAGITRQRYGEHDRIGPVLVDLFDRSKVVEVANHSTAANINSS